MLAKEGVPAVLAMQGKLSMSAATQFIPEFFRQLAEHGEVDRATASARAKIMDSPDWWIPVVFTRLNNARIWYPPDSVSPTVKMILGSNRRQYYQPRQHSYPRSEHERSAVRLAA